MLHRLHAAGLRLKLKKCLLEVDYLGHVVSSEGIRTDPKKTQAIRSPIPDTSTEKVRFGIVSVLTVEESECAATDSLATRQREDPCLCEITTYLEAGVLPEDEKFAKTLALSTKLVALTTLYYQKSICYA